MWSALFFVGPFAPTKRQQMLKSIGMAEVSRALGLRGFNRQNFGTSFTFEILEDAICSVTRKLEVNGSIN